MKYVNFFHHFLSTRVNINQSRLDRLNKHVTAIDRFLAQHFTAFDQTETQGSLALGTMIRPVSDTDEYDADLLLVTSHVAEWAPQDYIEETYNCFHSSALYKDKVHRRTRCVTLDYAADFHLDVVPCVPDSAGQYWICNRHTNLFELTDGTGYRDWFNRLNGTTGGNLKRVTRLLKYLRDHKDNFSAKSILLTTLAGKAVEAPPPDTRFTSVPATLVAVLTQIDEFLQSHPTLPHISNPVLPNEDFTRHWDQAKYTNFRDKIRLYQEWTTTAYNSTDRRESLEAWRKVFGSEFGSTPQATGGTTQATAGSVGSIIVAPHKPYAR